MWTVITTEEFDRWFAVQDELTQEKVLAALVLLEWSGPNLSRPFVDSLRGSQHPNMKELRVQHKGRPIRAFLPLTHYVRLSFCVPAIRPVTRSGFTKSCCLLLMRSLPSI